MNLDTPSIELVETQEDIPYIFSNPASFIIDESISVHHENSDNVVQGSEKEEVYKLVSNIEEFEELLRQHEVERYTKYTIYKTNGSFKGRGKDPAGKPRVHWGVLSKVSPELATTPYLIVGTRYYVCHLGKCYYTNKLQKFSSQNIEDNKRRYKKVTDSKKVGCPANFKVQRLILFPDNKLSQDTRSERARMGEHIRKNITTIPLAHKYLFKFPDYFEHKHHMDQHIEAGKEPIDKRVANKIRELVYAGKTNVETVSEILEEFVETQIKVNDKNRRRFFPPKVDIQRTIYKAKLSLRKLKNDQETIESFKSLLGDSTEVFFQPSNSDNQSLTLVQWPIDGANVSKKSGLVFVYQNEEMRRLYNIYGHHCILLDPSYKFCKYSYPLYFIAVQTNVNYQIVAMFITEFEAKDSLVEALTVLFHWNPTVIPKYAMTDNTVDEIKALESLFPEIKVFITTCYCEIAWKERLLRKDMSNLNRDEALNKLKSIANAVSEDKVQKAINDVKSWHSSSLKEYFEKSWQKEIKRWTIVYRPSDLMFESNEVVDRLYEEFKYIALCNMKNYTLSQMILHLCNNFIPETLLNYRTLNLSITQKQSVINFYIPSHMLHSPQWVLDFLIKVTSSADKLFPFSFVEQINESSYSLHSKSCNDKYYINFFSEQKQVTCTCLCFLKRKIICKHIIIVGRFHPMWNFEKICSWVFNRPIFKFDSHFAEFLISDNHYRESDNEAAQVENDDYSCIVTQDLYGNTSSVIKEECKQTLKHLTTLIYTFNSTELEAFHQSLKEFSLKWPMNKNTTFSKIKQEGNKKEEEEECEKDIPYPMLKKISDFYVNVEKKSEVKYGKRRGKKRKKEKCKKIKPLKFIKKEENGIEMCSITTFYENEYNFSSTEHNDDGSVNTKVQNYLEGENDIVIQINNAGDSKLELKADIIYDE